jgi:hypothetical protein
MLCGPRDILQVNLKAFNNVLYLSPADALAMGHIGRRKDVEGYWN